MTESEIENQFQNSVRIVNNILKTYSEFKYSFYFKKLYGLYKQALFGDNNTPCPFFYYLKSREKWDMWRHYKGTRKLSAKKRYIEVLNDFQMDSYGV